MITIMLAMTMMIIMCFVHPKGPQPCWNQGDPINYDGDDKIDDNEWILGPPYSGIGATIRIGRKMLCLPYAGFKKNKNYKQCCL